MTQQEDIQVARDALAIAGLNPDSAALVVASLGKFNAATSSSLSVERWISITSNMHAKQIDPDAFGFAIGKLLAKKKEDDEVKGVQL